MNKTILIFSTLFTLELSGQVSASSPPVFKEFEVYLERTMVGSERSAPHGSPTQYVYFGRKDGSKGVRSTETASGRSCTTTTIWRTDSFQSVTTSDCAQRKNTVPITSIPSPAFSLTTCRDTRSGWAFDGDYVLLGMPVERLRYSDKNVDAEVYLARDLGCLQVQSIHRWKDATGVVYGTTTDRLVRVETGRHDTSLFIVPASYRESLPSERLNAVHSHLFPGHNDDCATTGNQKRDDEYRKARARQTN